MLIHIYDTIERMVVSANDLVCEREDSDYTQGVVDLLGDYVEPYLKMWPNDTKLIKIVKLINTTSEVVSDQGCAESVGSMNLLKVLVLKELELEGEKSGK